MPEHDGFPVKCSGCQQEFLVDLERDLRSRPVEGERLITQEGYDCPHCGGWEHSHYANPSLKKMAQSLPLNTPKKLVKRVAKLKRKFDGLQKKMRQKRMLHSGES
jgi:DNA-directed RNA polymerase subunit RPC12/RpoP